MMDDSSTRSISEKIRAAMMGRRSSATRQSPHSSQEFTTTGNAKRRSKTDFVADSIKEMDPHTIIEMLEMYGGSSEDNTQGLVCLQSLKNSSSPLTGHHEQQRSSKKTSAMASSR